MITVSIAPILKGYFTVSDLLDSEGIIFIELLEVKNEGILFELNDKGYVFTFSIQNNSLVFQRNEFVSILTLHDIPISFERLGISFEWSQSTMVLQCIYGPGEEDIKYSSINTTPIIPTRDLLNHARKLNLLPTVEYNNEEEFRTRVHEALISIQKKIEVSGADNIFWNITYDGNKIISRTPKNEPDIHPFIHSMLSDILLQANIEIIPEYKSGIGNLDFLLIGRIKNGGNAYFGVEFKNAHSPDWKKGLLNQLPLYMKSKDITYAAYCVLDYRGEWYSKPDINKNIMVELDFAALKSQDARLSNVRNIHFQLGKVKSASK